MSDSGGQVHGSERGCDEDTCEDCTLNELGPR